MRRILHIDLDAFYAAIEQRDDPALRGKPIAVGSASARGVVATASYEARKFGVGSAMPSRMALERCPELIFVRPRFDVYRSVSREIRAIFESYTDLVEPLSLDEAYLDVTEPLRGPPSGTLIARAIKREIRRATGLTASAGVSYCKFLAKIASDMDKPDGLTVVTPDDAQDFIDALPIERFHGVGPKTAEKFHALGIRTGRDLRRLSEEELANRFGKVGGFYFRIARGIDERPVSPDRERKSVSTERTFADNRATKEALADDLVDLAEDLARRMERAGVQARGVFLKVKFEDHAIITRRVQVPLPVRSKDAFLEVGRFLLNEKVELPKTVRLLGIGAYDLIEGAAVQPPLFPDWVDTQAPKRST